MRTIVINNFTSYFDQLISVLNILGIDPDIESILDFDISNTNKYDLTILTGGNQNLSVYNPNLFEKEDQIIRLSKKPLIGICLGFEAIAYTFEASLEKQNMKIEGNTKIKLDTRFKLFSDLSEIEGYESHSWVLKEAPKKLEVLGTSEYGIEIIKSKTLPIYGFQFHPEMSPDSGKEAFKRVIKSF